MTLVALATNLGIHSIYVAANQERFLQANIFLVDFLMETTTNLFSSKSKFQFMKVLYLG